MSNFIQIKITPADVQKRLDKFLADFDWKSFYPKAENLSRGDFIRAIKNKFILVNKYPTKPSYRVSDGDILTIKSEIFSLTKQQTVANSKVNFETVFENENLIVVNKPAGLQVHPDYNEKRFTLVNGLLAKYPEISTVQDDKSSLAHLRPGIVHRLDKDTSGLIVVARNQKTFRELKKAFQEKTIRKKYLAIVYGIPKEKRGIIDKPLAKTSNYRRQTVAGKKTKTKIREAQTEYNFLKKLPGNLALLEVFPKTGRTHQIRVHLFSIGHPIVGDKLYKNKQIQLFPNLNRHLLHAQKIEFKLFGKKYSFSINPPSDFEKFLTTSLPTKNK